MLDILIWLGLGSVIGGLASLLTRHDAKHAPWRNVAVGAVGAVLAGWLVSPFLGRPSVNFGAFSLGPLVASGL
ncbi:MAG TPA: GlsB/YeaQ/YmgE family stress response membrane protein, partial [Rubrivivax sp.]|nr:GlsB/YeaQ/YmgE family stress response membrane protein [Rubrivivax sp.]